MADFVTVKNENEFPVYKLPLPDHLLKLDPDPAILEVVDGSEYTLAACSTTKDDLPYLDPDLALHVSDNLHESPTTCSTDTDHLLKLEPDPAILEVVDGSEYPLAACSTTKDDLPDLDPDLALHVSDELHESLTTCSTDTDPLALEPDKVTLKVEDGSVDPLAANSANTGIVDFGFGNRSYSSSGQPCGRKRVEKRRTSERKERENDGEHHGLVAYGRAVSDRKAPRCGSREDNVLHKESFPLKWSPGRPRRPVEGNPHTCYVCGKTFSSGKGLSCHRTKSHTSKYKCDICGKAYVTERRLIKHGLVTHAAAGKPFRCDDCGRLFTSQTSLTSHRLVHTGKMRYSCGICGKAYSTLKFLYRHKMSHTVDKYSEKRRSETDSGKRIKVRNTLIQPKPKSNSSNLKSNNSGGIGYKCDGHGKTCGRDFDLRLHRRLCTGNDQDSHRYNCGDCQKRFFDEGALLLHQRIHTGEKPYACDECGKMFAQGDTLNQHKLTHTDMKHYKCKECPEVFNNISALLSHNKTHISERCHRLTGTNRALAHL